MKETKSTTQSEEGIAKALFMYTETVSPSRDMLVNILNQIPEKEPTAHDRRAIRSPYIWVAITQLVSVCVIAIALLPSFIPTATPDSYTNSPFYAVDAQVETFEEGINEADYQAILVDYTM